MLDQLYHGRRSSALLVGREVGRRRLGARGDLLVLLHQQRRFVDILQSFQSTRQKSLSLPLLRNQAVEFRVLSGTCLAGFQHLVVQISDLSIECFDLILERADFALQAFDLRLRISLAVCLRCSATLFLCKFVDAEGLKLDFFTLLLEEIFNHIIDRFFNLRECVQSSLHSQRRQLGLVMPGTCCKQSCCCALPGALVVHHAPFLQEGRWIEDLAKEVSRIIAVKYCDSLGDSFHLFLPSLLPLFPLLVCH
mmetsp:Transcript_50858/g.94165  ORF Transcript_50858/g.94165 Transcript_50858/m.94165 type:complete len:251 (+) Transcript_50858:396-1148(+)